MVTTCKSAMALGWVLCCALLPGCSPEEPDRPHNTTAPRHAERRVARTSGPSPENEIEELFANESVLKSRLLEARQPSDSGSESLRKIIDHASAWAAKGDFGPAQKLLPLLDDQEKLAALESLMSVHSSLGTAFDLENKELLLKTGGLPENLKPFWRQVAAREASAKLDELVSDGTIDDLGGEMVAQLFETHTKSKPKSAFDLLTRHFEQNEMAARSVMRAALSTSPGFAQKSLAELPEGITKDAAIFELLNWMLTKGETEHFHAWAGQIKNETTKENAIKLLPGRAAE